jgi:hypothetical protein
MTSLLEGVTRSGTASSAQASGLPGQVAGKTGTTNEGRDAWFAGYSSRLLTVVWVGFDDGEAHGLTGAQAALPIWADFMGRALEAYPAPDFAVPPASSSPGSTPPTESSPATLPARHPGNVLTGTEPEPCDEHRGLSASSVGGSACAPAPALTRARPLPWLAAVALATVLVGCATSAATSAGLRRQPPGLRRDRHGLVVWPAPSWPAHGGGETRHAPPRPPIGPWRWARGCA